MNVRLCVSHENTVAVYVNSPLSRGNPDSTPLASRVRPCGNAPPVTVQVVAPPPPVTRSVSAYVAPMTPFGRALAEAIVTVVPKLPIRV